MRVCSVVLLRFSVTKRNAFDLKICVFFFWLKFRFKSFWKTSDGSNIFCSSLNGSMARWVYWLIQLNYGHWFLVLQCINICHFLHSFAGNHVDNHISWRLVLAHRSKNSRRTTGWIADKSLCVCHSCVNFMWVSTIHAIQYTHLEIPTNLQF